MREGYGDLFKAVGIGDIMCLTTNGCINSRNQCIMGRGCARTATEKWPQIGGLLANRIRMYGNIVNHIVNISNTAIYSFPVKPDYEIVSADKSNVVPHMRNRAEVGSKIAGWAAVAHPEIIVNSAHQLVDIVNQRGAKTVAIPRPGCGAGGLRWEDVKPLIEPIFDDRFWIIGYDSDRPV